MPPNILFVVCVKVIFEVKKIFTNQICLPLSNGKKGAAVLDGTMSLPYWA